MPRQKEIAAIERARGALQLTYAEIAQAITANEATLHRWRSGQSAPTAVFRLRLSALNDFMGALEGAHPDPHHARAWLDRPLPFLEGKTPRRLLAEGRPDLLTGILLARESGSAVPGCSLV